MPGGINLAWGGAALSSAGADTTASCGTLLTAAGASVKGSYSQLVASTACDAIGLIITAGPTTSNQRFSLDLAVGGAGSEQIIAPDLMFSFSANLGIAVAHFIPLSIPAGTRLSARVQGSAGGSPTLKVSVQLLDAGFDGLGALGACDVYGFVSGSTKGTTVDPGTSANTKGSWTQLVASTTRDIQALGVTFDGGGGGGGSHNSLVDIGVGAAASEQVLIPNIQETSVSTLGYYPISMLLFPMSIPASTRLSARAQSTSITSSQRNSTVTLYGFS